MCCYCNQSSSGTYSTQSLAEYAQPVSRFDDSHFNGLILTYKAKRRTRLGTPESGDSQAIGKYLNYLWVPVLRFDSESWKQVNE